jgi:tetratricopeptide (TPR) repeat protein
MQDDHTLGHKQPKRKSARWLLGAVLFCLPMGSVIAANGNLDAVVADAISQLGVKPKTVALPTDLALDTALAIKRGDYDTATKTINDVLARSHLKSWYFYPFNVFMNSITRGDDPVLLERVNDWLTRTPHSAIAHLVRAKYYESAAWAARSADEWVEVPDNKRKLFSDYLSRATADVRSSIAINPKIPWSYYILLDVVSGNANSPEMEVAFQHAIKIYPDYYELYRMRLKSLTPKWGGSIQSLYDFVDRYAARAPARSQRKLLYLHLYAYLMDAAWMHCTGLKADTLQKCVDADVGHSIQPGVAEGVRNAFELYKVSDPIEFNRTVWPVLKMMVETPGSEASAFPPVLQTAASVMGSDTQMVSQSEHNNYVLDDTTAKVWANIGNTANAEKKFRQALIDVEHTSFPDEAQKDEALAEILDDMTSFADRNSQFIDIIVYQDAANMVGGQNHTNTPYMKCYAYYRLKHYDEAAKECTRLIEGNGNYMQSHYWRAKAHEGLHEWDAALADFSPVAEGANNWFRVGAALDMSYILGEKHDFVGELASLNQHSYLFDERLQSHADLAVSYNNRCFAYMQLNQLQRALDDCIASLKFGRIPDASYKLQEIRKLLESKRPEL